MNAKIMVVDDEPGMLALMEVILKSKGFTVVAVGDSSKVIPLITKEKPDLFILDVMMPGISGIELCQHLRTRPETAQTPVLMLSALGEKEAIRRGIAAGANEYLQKTTPFTHIVSRVQALLGYNQQRLGVVDYH